MSSTSGSGYDFSPFYHASNVSVSPGSTFLATTYGPRVIVRTTANLSIVRTWHVTTTASTAGSGNGSGSGGGGSGFEAVTLSSVQWSDDGLYILVFSRTEGTAWVFSLAQEGSGDVGEVAKMEAGGVDPLERVEWARGGREVLGWTEHGLRLMIHSLSSGVTSAIQNPKASIGCHTFSPDNRYLAVVERHSGKEHVGVYDAAGQYHLIRHFALSAIDVQGISWSSCGRFIAVLDSRLSYSLYIHSPIGPPLTHFSHLSPTFSPLPAASSSSSALYSGAASTSTSTATIKTPSTDKPLHEDPGLGIRQVDWAVGGQYIVLSGYDGRLRILEADGWRCLAVLAPGARVGRDTTVWKEPNGWIRDTRGRGIVQFNRISPSTVLPTTTPSPSSLAQFSNAAQSSSLISPSARHILYQPPHQPTVLHIYTFIPSPGFQPDIKHVSAVVFNRPIRTVRWAGSTGTVSERSGEHKAKERIGVVCKPLPSNSAGNGDAGGAVYIWDEEGWEDVPTSSGTAPGISAAVENRGGVIEGIGIPNGAEFNPTDISFTPDGLSLAVRSRGEFCMMYDTDDEPFVGESGIDAVGAVGGSGTALSSDRDRQDEREWETEGLSFVREEDEDEDEDEDEGEGDVR